MSETSPFEDDSVYGGELSQVDFYKLEFDVDEKFPNWEIVGDGQIFRMNTPMGEVQLAYPNAKIYLFDPPYDWMSHIYHKPEPKAKPLYIIRPQHSMEEGEKYDEMVDEMVCAGFRLITSGYPEGIDLDMWYETFRGKEPIETVIGRILLEAENGEQ